MEVIMSALKSLTFAPMPERQGRDPRLTRRLKLIEKLEEQRALIKNPNYTLVRRKWQRSDDGTRSMVEVSRRVKPWWRTDSKGTVVLSVKYGFSTIEFEKGNTGIVVGKPEKLDSTIVTLIDAVKTGEIDTLLETAAKKATIKRPAK
jgi:hypothetical protein